MLIIRFTLKRDTGLVCYVSHRTGIIDCQITTYKEKAMKVDKLEADELYHLRETFTDWDVDFLPVPEPEGGGS